MDLFGFQIVCSWIHQCNLLSSSLLVLTFYRWSLQGMEIIDDVTCQWWSSTYGISLVSSKFSSSGQYSKKVSSILPMDGQTSHSIKMHTLVTYQVAWYWILKIMLVLLLFHVSLFSCSSGVYFALKYFLSGTVAMDTNQGGAAINLVDDR